MLDDTMGTVGEICVLAKYSPKLEKMLGTIQENVEGDMADDLFQRTHTFLDSLSVTRWAVRASCISKELYNYDELLTL